MRISSNRLRALVAEIGDQHRRSADLRHQRADEAHRAGLRSRRRFLAGAGVGSAALAVGGAVGPFRVLAGAQEGDEPSDEDRATFLASVELVAVDVYQQAVDSGLLSTPLISVADRFRDHHQEYADSYAEAAGSTPEPNSGVADLWATSLEEAVDELSMLNVLVTVEETLAATALEALAESDAELGGLISTILPIEGQQAAVMGNATGDLEPNEFLSALQTTSGALDPASYPTE